MKNLFAFGFLALALTVASCGNNATKTEETADSLKEVVDSNLNAVADSLKTATDSVLVKADSIADSTKNAQ